MKPTILFLFLVTLGFFGHAQLQQSGILNEPKDISSDFSDMRNTYYLAEKLTDFDPVTASGKVQFERYNYQTQQAFDNMLLRLAPVNANEFPTTEYQVSPQHPFSIEFIH